MSSPSHLRRSGNNPNEALSHHRHAVSHPVEDDDSHPFQQVHQPMNSSLRLSASITAYQQQTPSSLASKPHAFSGAVLTPDHARNLTPALALSLSSALSLQAANAAQNKGVLPPGETINLFQGSGAEILAGLANHTNNNNLSSNVHSLILHSQFSSPVHSANHSSVLQLLQQSSTPQTNTMISTMAIPSTATHHIPTSNNNLCNKVPILSIAEALEHIGSWSIQYTVWITEAWNVLKWSEPSAALFWEMATLYHTLHVANLSACGGGSATDARIRVLTMNALSATGETVGRADLGTTSQSANPLPWKAKGSFPPQARQNYIPPILSCGSQSSMGSVKSWTQMGETPGGEGKIRSSSGGDISASGEDSLTDPPTSYLRQHLQQHQKVSNSSMNPARHSAKELPVWLISMFLLLHCEDQVYLRCTSAEDERRLSNLDNNTPKSFHSTYHNSSTGDSLDFSTMLLRKTLTPRTPLYPTMHQNNANCASFLLRHLRKFLLLCAVPRNTNACRAVAVLAAQHANTAAGCDRSLRSVLSSTMGYLDISQVEELHEKEHRNIGLTVQLSLEELDRLNLVMQAPSGGPVEEPTIAKMNAIGEHIFKCLAMEEIQAREAAGGRSTAASLHRISLMQNGLITVADAERILRRYLEEELTMAQQELDGDDNDNTEDVTTKFSRLSLTCRSSGNETIPASPTRPRGFSATDSIVTDACPVNDSNSVFKELSYRNLRSTTVLLESNKDLGSNNNASNADNSSVLSHHSQLSGTQYPPYHQAIPQSDPYNECARLHDLHIADCSDTHFYLLQPFEHATIAACIDCTIVVGAVAGLLHIVDCERTTISTASRRVVVSNALDVITYVFTPSPPLLVGDNKGCQFAPYNTYYDEFREDLLATGLAAALISAGPSHGAGDTSTSPTRGGGDGVRTSPTTPPALQCASNKWKVPIEISKMEVLQLPNVATLGLPSASEPSSLGNISDERALKNAADTVVQTPILLPASDFEILVIPVESEEARLRRRLLRQAEEEATNEAEGNDVVGEDSGDATTVYSNSSSLTGDRERGDQASSRSEGPVESDYCKSLIDILTLLPFNMPHDYERKAIAKAEKVRVLQQAMMELNEQQRANLQEELNRGFQDWLVTSGNLRQVLDLVHLEKKVSA